MPFLPIGDGILFSVGFTLVQFSEASGTQRRPPSNDDGLLLASLAQPPSLSHHPKRYKHRQLALLSSSVFTRVDAFSPHFHAGLSSQL